MQLKAISSTFSKWKVTNCKMEYTICWKVLVSTKYAFCMFRYCWIHFSFARNMRWNTASTSNCFRKIALDLALKQQDLHCTKLKEKKLSAVSPRKTIVLVQFVWYNHFPFLCSSLPLQSYIFIVSHLYFPFGYIKVNNFY